MKAVAAEANAPNTILLVVLKDGPIQSVDDLKGRTVSVSTAGSLTYWLTQQLSRAQGWGDNGIKIAPLGSAETQIAALKTHQIDGVTTDGATVYRFTETGDGRILVIFGDRMKDFHVHVIYASDSLIAGNPEALKSFSRGRSKPSPICATTGSRRSTSPSNIPASLRPSPPRAMTTPCRS